MLAPESPLPATSGLRLRILHLARQLATSAEVELAVLGAVDAAPDEPFRLIGIPHTTTRGSALLRGLRRPYMAAKLASPAMAAFASEARWDTVHAELPFLVPAALNACAPVVLGAQNVETEVVLSFVDIEPSALRRARWRWEARKTESFERAMTAAAAAVCTPSERDAAIFRSWGAKRVAITPNGVDTDAVTFRDDRPGAGLLYVGHFGYRPNVAAANELIDEIFPLVRSTVDGATVTLVGRDPPPALRARAGGDVVVTGEVTEVLPYLHEARALVVPLRTGGGTRLKVLEAMAAGLPVVSTSFGVSGLDVTPDRDFLHAESAPALARQAIRVIQDEALETRVAENARRLVERCYDWAAAARSLVELHRDLAER